MAHTLLVHGFRVAIKKAENFLIHTYISIIKWCHIDIVSESHVVLTDHCQIYGCPFEFSWEFWHTYQFILILAWNNWIAWDINGSPQIWHGFSFNFWAKIKKCEEKIHLFIINSKLHFVEWLANRPSNTTQADLIKCTGWENNAGVYFHIRSGFEFYYYVN